MPDLNNLPASPPADKSRLVAWAFGIALALMFAVVVGFTAWRAMHSTGQAERAAQAQAELAPAAQALERAVAAATPAAPSVAPVYDIDRTLAVLRELDAAASDARSVRDYVERLARQDYAHVAPQALEVRQRMLELLTRLAGQLDALDDHDKTWSTYRTVLEALKAANSVMIGVPGVLSTSPSIEQRNAATAELQKALAQREDLLARVRPIEAELVRLVSETTPVFRALLSEWEQLCLVRDSSYLAAARLDWEACARHARAAIARAPLESEAHLLLALAHVEGGVELPAERGDLARFVDELIAREPERAAPALVVRGVWRARRGESALAREDFELAATRYPQQSERLRAGFDPYASRAYLRQTSAGRGITGLYEASMLGAAWFSPELQLARERFGAGDREAGKRLIREHFHRRRADGQWNLVLYDLDFCEGLLGPEFAALFPEVNYLDLEISRPMFGNDVAVSVSNRSDVTLRNAALVLCLRFVDMHPDDYVTLAVKPTQPVLPARTVTQYDGFDVKLEWGGVTKSVDQLIEPVRAILLTDEAVFRVETIRYKNERMQRYATQAGAPPVSLPERVEQALVRLRAEPQLASLRTAGLLGQDVRVELPREFLVLGPLFRLEFGEQRFDEVEDRGSVRHVLENERVALTFDNAGLQLGLAKPDEVRVLARSLSRTLTLAFARDAAGEYSLARIE
jgi:hypothetical protein